MFKPINADDEFCHKNRLIQPYSCFCFHFHSTLVAPFTRLASKEVLQVLLKRCKCKRF